MPVLTSAGTGPARLRIAAPHARRACRILALMDYYLPAIKIGGPITTVSSMVEQLGTEFSWSILTRDRDLHDRQSYPHLVDAGSTRVGRAAVHYLGPQSLRWRNLTRSLNSIPYDLLYLNSAFSARFSVLPLILRQRRRIPVCPVVLAPRGELSRGSLGHKWWKKRPYLWLTRSMNLYADVIWHASSDFERADIEREFGQEARVIVAPNLAPERVTCAGGPEPKVPGRLNAVFLSGIHPVKNLAAALRMLRGLRGAVELSIYGPVRDEACWAQCRKLIGELPATVSVQYHGPVAREDVLPTLARHDLLLLPTLGENFGHVIYEALQAGCPVLISNRTPWRDLERLGAGWDLPLEEPSRFQQVLQTVIDMDAADHERLRQGARRCAARAHAGSEALEANRRVFQEAMRIADE